MYEDLITVAARPITGTTRERHGNGNQNNRERKKIAKQLLGDKWVVVGLRSGSDYLSAAQLSLNRLNGRKGSRQRSTPYMTAIFKCPVDFRFVQRRKVSGCKISPLNSIPIVRYCQLRTLASCLKTIVILSATIGASPVSFETCRNGPYESDQRQFCVVAISGRRHQKHVALEFPWSNVWQGRDLFR